MSVLFRIVSAFLLIAQLVLLPVISAQDIQPAPIQGPESDICVLPRDQYKIFNAYRLNYQAAIVDKNLTFANNIFVVMQDILDIHCGSSASIIQVQAETLDESCNNILNHLLAKNKFYITQ